MHEIAVGLHGEPPGARRVQARLLLRIGVQNHEVAVVGEAERAAIARHKMVAIEQLVAHAEGAAEVIAYIQAHGRW